MAKNESVNEKMSSDFLKITLMPEESEPSLAEIKQQLESNNHRYAIFVRNDADDSHTVVRMFDSVSEQYSDLKTAAEVLMDDILNTEEIMLAVSKPEVPGVTVVKDGKPVGVLSRDVLMQSFTEQRFAVRTQLQGDWKLGGETGQGKPYMIMCVRPGCNTLNKVTGFDPGRTLCINGHVLEMATK